MIKNMYECIHLLFNNKQKNDKSARGGTLHFEVRTHYSRVLDLLGISGLLYKQV